MKFVLLLGICGLLAAQEPRRVFLITDAEGIAGVCRQDQTDPHDPEMPALLTGEINAAVEGFLEGGATEVVVWDGHGAGNQLSVSKIHPKARLVMGTPSYTLTLERRYSAVAFIGQHAMANTRNGVMGHSYDSLRIQYLRLNGKPVGEVETRAALAGHFGTPVIFISGDQAAIDEARGVVPRIGAAVVKQGLGRYACDSLSAPAARELVKTQARESMKLLGHIAPYQINGPVTIEVEYSTRNSISARTRNLPGITQVDDRTLRFQAPTFLEAWRLFDSLQ